MNIDVAEWLCRLPLADEQAGDGIVLDGWLVPGEDGRTDISVRGLRLSFRSQDVLETQSVETEDAYAPSSPRAVRLLVRRGAAVLDIRPDEFCVALPPRRKPFALAVRPSHQLLGPANRFRELEREFLQKHGLIDT
jgi:hypothetical protein